MHLFACLPPLPPPRSSDMKMTEHLPSSRSAKLAGVPTPSNLPLKGMTIAFPAESASNPKERALYCSGIHRAFNANPRLFFHFSPQPRLDSWALFLIIAIACTLSSLAASPPVPPPDWKIELIAKAPEVRHPTVVCAAPDGRVFVAEDPMDISTPRADAQDGRILCFFADGHHTVFAEKLHAVFGLQYLEGNLYVLHNPQFSVFRDENGIGKDRFELIESMNPNPWALDWNDHVPAKIKHAMDCYI
jgi:hypothetical protein